MSMLKDYSGSNNSVLMELSTELETSLKEVRALENKHLNSQWPTYVDSEQYKYELRL